MIVFIAGMQRSGSTFCFNVIRELLKRRGTVYQEPCSTVVSAVDRSANTQHLLFKAHTADNITLRLIELGAIKVVCSIRRPEDAIASWIETFDFNLNDSIAHMRDWLIMFDRLRAHALVVCYEQIDNRPLHAAFQIARHICPEFRIEEIRDIATKYAKEKIKLMADGMRKDDSNIKDLGFSFYNKETFFHRKHVSSLVSRPAIQRIGEDAVAHIRRELESHINPNGDIKGMLQV